MKTRKLLSVLALSLVMVLTVIPVIPASAASVGTSTLTYTPLSIRKGVAFTVYGESTHVGYGKLYAQHISGRTYTRSVPLTFSGMTAAGKMKYTARLALPYGGNWQVWSTVGADATYSAATSVKRKIYCEKPTFTSAIDRTTVTYDAPAVFSGQLKSASGKVLAGRTVKLYRVQQWDETSYEYTAVRTLKTDAYGRVSANVKYDDSNVYWQWRFAGDADNSFSASTMRKTNWKPLVLESYLQGSPTSGKVALSKGHTYQLLFIDGTGIPGSLRIKSPSGAKTYSKAVTGGVQYTSLVFTATETGYYAWAVVGAVGTWYLW